MSCEHDLDVKRSLTVNRSHGDTLYRMTMRTMCLFTIWWHRSPEWALVA